MTHAQIGEKILRYSLSAVFLYFGFSQLFDSTSWVYLVPNWATNLSNLAPATIVLANGIFEITLGTLLAMGLFVRPISIILALHLALVTIEMGFTPTGARDFGLTFATAALFFFEEK